MQSFPLLDNNLNEITNLTGTRAQEFKNLFALNLNDELLNPLAFHQVSGKNVGLYIEGGLENQTMNSARKNILSNNYDPTEEFKYTDSEALQYINTIYNTSGALNETQRQIESYMSTPYDPKLREQLAKEQIKQNTDFNVSQDFVKEYRSSLQSYYKEKNIYNASSSDTEKIAQVIKNLAENQDKLDRARIARYLKKAGLTEQQQTNVISAVVNDIKEEGEKEVEIKEQ